MTLPEPTIVTIVMLGCAVDVEIPDFDGKSEEEVLKRYIAPALSILRNKLLMDAAWRAPGDEGSGGLTEPPERSML